jgi:hypothetical protein
MASNKQVSALVNYYLREGYRDSVLEACEILLKRSPSDVLLQFWKAFALYVTGSVSQVSHTELPCWLRCSHLRLCTWLA